MNPRNDFIPCRRFYGVVAYHPLQSHRFDPRLSRLRLIILIYQLIRARSSEIKTVSRKGWEVFFAFLLHEKVVVVWFFLNCCEVRAKV